MYHNFEKSFQFFICSNKFENSLSVFSIAVCCCIYEQIHLERFHIFHRTINFFAFGYLNSYTLKIQERYLDKELRFCQPHWFFNEYTPHYF
jgi:hypothetical protein